MAELTASLNTYHTFLRLVLVIRKICFIFFFKSWLLGRWLAASETTKNSFIFRVKFCENVLQKYMPYQLKLKIGSWKRNLTLA